MKWDFRVSPPLFEENLKRERQVEDKRLDPSKRGEEERVKMKREKNEGN